MAGSSKDSPVSMSMKRPSSDDDCSFKSSINELLFEKITCPISGSLMVFPITLSDQFTYSASAISGLFASKKNPLSPFTRKPLQKHCHLDWFAFQLASSIFPDKIKMQMLTTKDGKKIERDTVLYIDEKGNFKWSLNDQPGMNIEMIDVESHMKMTKSQMMQYTLSKKGRVGKTHEKTFIEEIADDAEYMEENNPLEDMRETVKHHFDSNSGKLLFSVGSRIEVIDSSRQTNVEKTINQVIVGEIALIRAIVPNGSSGEVQVWATPLRECAQIAMKVILTKHQNARHSSDLVAGLGEENPYLRNDVVNLKLSHFKVVPHFSHEEAEVSLSKLESKKNEKIYVQKLEGLDAFIVMCQYYLETQKLAPMSKVQKEFMEPSYIKTRNNIDCGLITFNEVYTITIKLKLKMSFLIETSKSVAPSIYKRYFNDKDKSIDWIKIKSKEKFDGIKPMHLLKIPSHILAAIKTPLETGLFAKKVRVEYDQKEFIKRHNDKIPLLVPVKRMAFSSSPSGFLVEVRQLYDAQVIADSPHSTMLGMNIEWVKVPGNGKQHFPEQFWGEKVLGGETMVTPHCTASPMYSPAFLCAQPQDSAYSKAPMAINSLTDKESMMMSAKYPGSKVSFSLSTQNFHDFTKSSFRSHLDAIYANCSYVKYGMDVDKDRKYYFSCENYGYGSKNQQTLKVQSSFNFSVVDGGSLKTAVSEKHFRDSVSTGSLTIDFNGIHPDIKMHRIISKDGTVNKSKVLMIHIHPNEEAVELLKKSQQNLILDNTFQNLNRMFGENDKDVERVSSLLKISTSDFWSVMRKEFDPEMHRRVRNGILDYLVDIKKKKTKRDTADFGEMINVMEMTSNEDGSASKGGASSSKETGSSGKDAMT